MASESELKGKTFVWRPKASDATPKKFEFSFGDDGSFVYRSSEAPELPTVTGSGQWALQGKKIKLTWKEDNVEAETGDNFSELYTDLKYGHNSE